MANSLFLFSLFLFMAVSLAAGTQFRVGGTGTWAIPDSNAMSYNQWAEKNRFQVGDSISFMYLPDKDSVLLVDADAYNSCNTSSHIDEFNDGNTVFTFARSGAFHFISGIKDNCDKNEKLVVVVMVDRSNSSSLAPAAPPTSSSSSPPPPPSEGATGEPTPTPNAASSKVVGVISTFGAILGALSYVF
ncbi:early nodulin-like protein 1 [Canna indica]|uniref:Early nodulin-like protein 1 n=1 Tax=Canna indica TaxID=4628 RepID=A0AAQ3JMN0_9LILI|nr:early nodulin-like protein 1 [Canna indica]